MKTTALVPVIVLMLAGSAVAQTRSARAVPPVPRPPVVVHLGWGAMPQCHHASTVAESYARGMAALRCAQGQYNLLTSMAAINAQQARQQELANRRTAVESFYDLRQRNEQYRVAQCRKTRSPEVIRTVSLAAKPDRGVSPPKDREIVWPSALMADELAPDRAELERAIVETSERGQVAPDQRQRVAEAARALLAELKDRVGEVSPQEYMAANRWLESLTRG